MSYNMKKKCCENPMWRDLTENKGPIRDYSCMWCHARLFNGIYYSPEEWERVLSIEKIWPYGMTMKGWYLADEAEILFQPGEAFNDWGPLRNQGRKPSGKNSVVVGNPAASWGIVKYKAYFQNVPFYGDDIKDVLRMDNVQLSRYLKARSSGLRHKPSRLYSLTTKKDFLKNMKIKGKSYVESVFSI